MGERFHCYAAQCDYGPEVPVSSWNTMFQLPLYCFIYYRSSGSTVQSDRGNSVSELFCNHKIEYLNFLSGLLSVLNFPLVFYMVLPTFNSVWNFSNKMTKEKIKMKSEGTGYWYGSRNSQMEKWQSWMWLQDVLSLYAFPLKYIVVK